MSTFLNENLPLNKPLWEIHFVENFSEDTSVVLMRINHTFTDATGFISLMSCLNDDKYKLKIDKKFPQVSWAMQIFYALFGPLYCLYLGGVMKFLSTDSNTKKINELTRKNSYKNKFYISEEIPFQDIRKCYKRFKNTTFNDYILGVISTNFHKWFEMYGIRGTQRILTAVPINTRDLPKSLEDLKIDNNSVGK